MAGRAVLSTQVLQEFCVNTTRKLSPPLASEAVEERVRDFSRLSLVRIETAMISSSIGRNREYMLSFWEASSIESALKGGADRLLTENLRHGQVIEVLKVGNPFLYG